MKRARSVLICHHDEPLNRFGLARWMASFTDLAAIVVVREPPARLRRRIRREIQRVGLFRFVDVLAFRVYYRFALAEADKSWTEATLNDLSQRYTDIPASCRVLETPSPNSPEAVKLLQEVQPDLIVARCKNILREEVFKAAPTGTFVMHPGVCPEYRNAHGCFWALARRDLENVGMTLLRVDPGVDTGPVYGYYRCHFDESRESHVVIQNRVVFDNLDLLRAKFEEILGGTAQTIDTTGEKLAGMGPAMAHELPALEARGPPEIQMTARAFTLLYHDVVPEGRWDSSGFEGADADVYKLDCADFRQHLAAIEKILRQPPTTGPALLAHSAAEHPVLITFDDGGVSAALYIADMLEERAWKGHFFVTGGRIGTSGFLDPTQIQDLHRRGHIIGSHSYSHPLRMAHCSPEQLYDEWHRSALVLSDILGEPIQIASVPGGDYSRQVAVAASRAGIKLLFNSEPLTRWQVVNDCVVMGRITVKRGHLPERSAGIAAGNRQLQIREYLFWNAKKIAKRLLGGAWLRARVMLLERREKKVRDRK